MRCPTLADLPAPPPGKTGWPWTIESPQLPDTMPDGRPWPRISIVTPSYNQGQFIEETIRSVLLQGYPEVEYIIMDGGSEDGTVDIIRKYGPWIARWTTGRDGGQAAAINNGFTYASGQIYNWLNSDDHLLPHSLHTIAKVFTASPDVDIYIGANISSWADHEHSVVIGPSVAGNVFARDWPALQFGMGGVPQDATFFSKHMWESVGGLDASLHFVFDSVFYSQSLIRARRVALNNRLISVMRRHKTQKTHINFYAEPEMKECIPTLKHLSLRTKFMRRIFCSRLALFAMAFLSVAIPQSKRKFIWVDFDADLNVYSVNVL